MPFHHTRRALAFAWRSVVRTLVFARRARVEANRDRAGWLALQDMNDRELADLGISRDQIPRFSLDGSSLHRMRRTEAGGRSNPRDARREHPAFALQAAGPKIVAAIASACLTWTAVLGMVDATDAPRPSNESRLPR